MENLKETIIAFKKLSQVGKGLYSNNIIELCNKITTWKGQILFQS